MQYRAFRWRFYLCWRKDRSCHCWWMGDRSLCFRWWGDRSFNHGNCSFLPKFAKTARVPFLPLFSLQFLFSLSRSKGFQMPKTPNRLNPFLTYLSSHFKSLTTYKIKTNPLSFSKSTYAFFQTPFSSKPLLFSLFKS